MGSHYALFCYILTGLIKKANHVSTAILSFVWVEINHIGKGVQFTIFLANLLRSEEHTSELQSPR